MEQFYRCSYCKDFTGTAEEVTEHEETCKCKPSCRTQNKKNKRYKIKTCEDLQKITQKLNDKVSGHEPGTLYEMAVLDLCMYRLDEYVEQAKADNSLLSDKTFQKKFEFVFSIAMNYLGEEEL